MDYVRFAISNPVKVAVGVLLIVLFGFVALAAIPIQLVPNVDTPVVTVETTWTGRSPQEIEREILEEQEERLKSVDGLKKMTSVASEGSGEITLEFYIGKEMDRAVFDVSDKLREVPSYPDDVDEPVITAADAASENAVAWMLIESEDPDFSIEGFYDFADKRIKPTLERTPGLSRINIYGGREQQVHVKVDPTAMAQRGVTYEELRNALSSDNASISAGGLQEGRLDWRIRVTGEFDQLDLVRDTIVRSTEAGPIRVSDVAKVELVLEERRRFVRANGQSALAMNAIRATGSNVMEVMEGLRGNIEMVNEQVLPAYEGDKYKLRIRQVYDETVYIDDAINVVLQNLVIGGTLAGMVLLLFLRTIRPTLIVFLAIPISVIGTFVVMTLMGRNLNVISLAGLSFAVGMVVDNAIVVLENIDRHLQMGKRPALAAYDGAREVWGAIVASTLTTLAVFVPVLIMEEEAGQLFRDIAVAICAAVTLSLFVSVTVIPAASARWLRPHRERTGLGAIFKSLFGLTYLINRVIDLYATFIYKLSARNVPGYAARGLIIVGLTFVSLFGAYLLVPPATYLPNGNQNLIFAIMFTPPAYHIDHNEFIGTRVEDTVRPFWEADSYQDTSEAPPVIDYATGQPYEKMPWIENYFFVSFSGTIFMGAASADKENVAPLAGLLNKAMGTIPGSFGFAMQRSIFGGGFGGSNSIDVEIFGNDLDRLRSSADALYNKIAAEFGYQSVRPQPLNFNLGGPELQLTLNQVTAKDLTLDTNHLGLIAQTLVDGVRVKDYRYEGDSLDLVMIRDENYPMSIDSMVQVPVPLRSSSTGEIRVVPLGSVVTERRTESPQQIRRIEEIRAITLTVTPPGNMPLEEAEGQVEGWISELREAGSISPDMEIAYAGSADKLTQVRRSLLGSWSGWSLDSISTLATGRFFLAILIVYLLMAALFESFLYPLVIMFSVPLSTVGGFMGLAIVHWFNPTQQLDVLTMLGFVILVGVVVNNAILIVHQALNFMRGQSDSEASHHEPLPPREAIRESVRSRFRPIFMTTATSVFGMLPLVVMPGSGTELYRGLGSVMVGGLVVASLFTLLIVPLLFSVVIDVKLLVARMMGVQATEFVAAAGFENAQLAAAEQFKKDDAEHHRGTPAHTADADADTDREAGPAEKPADDQPKAKSVENAVDNAADTNGKADDETGDNGDDEPGDNAGKK